LVEILGRTVNGPAASTRTPPLTKEQSYAFCRKLARREAGNFYHAFRLLPRRQRLAMSALYSFLRLSDDLGDNSAPTDQKRLALADWRRQLKRSWDGEDGHAVFPALRHTAATYGISRELFETALDGVEMDLDTTRYATFADLEQYCYRVASVVGLACIRIWECHDEGAGAYAESAGTAFQLTNILRDLGEDCDRGRIYLPQEDLERFGYPEEHLRRRERSPAFRELMAFEVARARSYYRAAEPLTSLLSPPGRAVYQVMSRTYRSLLELIEKSNYDVFSQRVHLGSWRKLGLALQALPARFGWR
jgi:phytoene synthase